MDPATRTESRKTPDILPTPGSTGRPLVSSPMKPIIRPVSGRNAEELAQRVMLGAMLDHSDLNMWGLLGKTPESMRAEFPELKLPKLEPMLQSARQTRSKPSYEPYIKFLNKISATIHEVLSKGPSKDVELIQFFECPSDAPKDHPTGMTCRPAFLAQKVPAGEKPSMFYWSALEATGEITSGKDIKKSALKTAAYTSFLLQARPDRVRVQGIYVDREGFKLVVSNACGAFNTKFLDWDPYPSRLLLTAWMLSLYRPIADLSITTQITPNKAPTFKIDYPDQSYEGCSILSVGSGFGRRTIVFKTSEKNTVIKEQYIETCRRFEEGETLSKIHKNGSFPGVVRLGWGGSVVSGQEKLVVKREDTKGTTLYERKKTRMVLLDEAGSLMDTETLRDVLIAIYDLLELTRFLHTHRKVFHRDISIRNVLLRKEFPTADTRHPPPATDLQDMCFASYLLSSGSSVSVLPSSLGGGSSLPAVSGWKVASSKTEEKQKKGPRPRPGTPVFMARAVRSARQLRGKYCLPAMPQLSDGHSIYEQAVGNRLTSFPPNKPESYIMKDDKSLEPFIHRLRYDAEPVFWLLVWWALQAQPEVNDETESRHIPNSVWQLMTDEPDMRDRFVPRFCRNAIHPYYEQLEPLLEQMAEQLDGDLEESNEPSRRKDEYLHEAFQRLIFDFLHKNYDEPFMTTPKSPDPRTPKSAAPMQAPMAAHQVDKIRSSVFVASSPSVPLSSSAGNLRSNTSRNSKPTGVMNSNLSDVDDSDYNERAS